MISSKSAVHVLFGLSVALQTGCSSETDIPVSSTTDNTASPAAAIPVQTFESTSNPQYTGKVLSDGSVLLDWPMDPEATGYAIYRDDTLVAEVPPDSLSFTDSGQLLNDATQPGFARNDQETGRRVSYTIYSIKPDNRQSIWVDQLEVIMSPESELPTTGSEESPTLQAANPDTQSNIPTVSTGTGAPIPVDPEPNSIPRIDSISLGCDFVLESIGIEVGVATNFTLFVEDESPLTLSYSAISNDTSVADVSVDSSGVFTVIGSNTGNTTLSIVVTDDKGLQDQLQLKVVSEL